MRKIFAVVLLAATLLSLLSGCGGELEAATAPAGSGLTGTEVLDNFENLMADSEMADHYTVTRLPITHLPDTGETYQALVVTDNLLGDSYHLDVRSTPEGEVYQAGITHHNEDYGYFAFATFCLYLVNSLELTEVDGLELCDALGLLSAEPKGSVAVAEWELWAVSIDNLLHFSATYEAD